MRAHRLALFLGWLLVSSLAVAGFAAFSADSTAPESPEEVPVVVVSPEIGRSAGSVAAMTFSLLAEGASAGSASSFDGDLSALIGGDATSTTEQATTSTSPSSRVIDRSTFFDESEVRLLIEQYFEAEDVSRAIRIAWCESSFNPENVNPVSGTAGLFQHSPDTWSAHSTAAGFAGADILDPDANVAVAAWMLYELPGGWTHWECQA